MSDPVVPIACTLSPNDMSVRLVDLEELLAAHVESAERRPSRLRLTFKVPGADGAARIRDLFAREQECCGFFSVTFTRQGDRLTVDIGVPEEAGPTLDFLQVLAERHLPRAGAAG
ncbi:MAG TPA: hypothetical protein VH912_28450 [Streptosporangiaceae bacterium]